MSLNYRVNLFHVLSCDGGWAFNNKKFNIQGKSMRYAVRYRLNEYWMSQLKIDGGNILGIHTE